MTASESESLTTVGAYAKLKTSTTGIDGTSSRSDTLVLALHRSGSGMKPYWQAQLLLGAGAGGPTGPPCHRLYLRLCVGVTIITRVRGTVTEATSTELERAGSHDTLIISISRQGAACNSKGSPQGRGSG